MIPGGVVDEAVGARFGLVELDLLATHAGVPCPFPLRVPSFGRIGGEREVLLNTAGQTLNLRGLADDSGPTGLAADLVAALREHRGTVDLVLSGPGGTTGVAALIYRSSALILRRELGADPADVVTVHRVAEGSLLRELLAMVPELDGVRALPITLPARAVEAANGLIADVGHDAERQRLLRDLVREHGGDPAQLDHLIKLLPKVRGQGQLGATERNRGGATVRAGGELSWVDGPRGRVRIGRNGDWVSINPLREADLATAFGELIAATRPTR
ncbi:ESX secretion-associated protein EspG [Saccharopolyspora gloriosae]|uniref:ESX secretion-associated protein EspG n=1 Tax=Saccharopolyspora gloriosae TaxID=455344 RepID=UPI001FB82D09|nr:ESX secretion-associated protein EspG [Saccharopolyspora gloriosae]